VRRYSNQFAAITVTPTRAERLAALRHRDFLLLWLGQGVSQLGTEVQKVAVLWQLYLLTRSPVALGLLALFRVVPILALALVAGMVVDNANRRKLMILTQLIPGLGSTALALLTLTHHVTPAAIYTFTFFSGFAYAFESPSRQALLPNLVPREALANAFSLTATARQVAAVVGPALGGLLLTAGSFTFAYVFDALSFAAVIASLHVIRPRLTRSEPARISLQSIFEALRFVRFDKVILGMMALDFLATFFAGTMLLIPIFADQVLRVGVLGVGLLQAAPSVGAFATALGMSILPDIRRYGRVMLISVVIFGIAITLFGMSKVMWLSLVCLAVSGAADTVSMVVRQTVRNLRTPDELRGRMTGVNMLFVNGGPQLGEVRAGLMARWLGAPLSVVTGGAACVAMVFVATALFPALRRHRA
jgi:MFS family permease